MSSTIFIAVQCCQCSTMQVKPQKKSSNKWNCVVCNQKQSVRRVFAQGFRAKDLREFVQSFNMSRKASDEQGLLLLPDQQTLEAPILHDQRNKRKDWSEYLDQEGEGGKEGEDIEAEIVTELPTEMFKKPRLNKFSTTNDKLFKPVFTKLNKRIPAQEEKQMKDCQTAISSATANGMKCEEEGGEPRTGHCSSHKEMSKWDYYIVDDDNDDDDHNHDHHLQLLRSRDSFASHGGQSNYHGSFGVYLD